MTSLAPEEKKRLEMEALIAFRAKDWDTAETMLVSALAGSPENFSLNMAMAEVDLRQDRAVEAFARLPLLMKLKPSRANLARFGKTCLENAFRDLFQAGDLLGARSMAGTLAEYQEREILDPDSMPGDLAIAATMLLGEEKDRIASICAKAGRKCTLLAIRRTGKLNCLQLENLWDAATETFPQDAEVAGLCAQMNVLAFRHEGKACAEAFETWLKFAQDSENVGDIYNLYRNCLEPEIMGRMPFMACRDVLDQAVGEAVTDSKRLTAVICACNFLDLNYAEKNLSQIRVGTDMLDEARERVSGLRDALDGLTVEVQEAAERFWSSTATSPDPLAAARRSLREEKDKVAIAMPFGQVQFGRKETRNHARVLAQYPKYAMRIIKRTIRLLQERGLEYRIHMWPWPLFENPPLAGDARVLAYHTIATETDSRTVIHKGSHLPGTWSIDRSGYSGWSSLRHLTRDDISNLDDAPHEREAFFHALREKFIDANRTILPQPDSSEAMPPDGYVFLATQMPSDSVQAIAWIDQPALIAETIRWAERTSKALVIKRHPLCKDIRVTRLLDRELPSNVHVSRGPIHDLIKPSSVVIVGNSGVGFEALMHGKSVIAVAPSDYQVATRTARTVDALRKLLDGADSQPDDSEFARTFVHVFLKKLVIDPDDDAAVDTALTRHFEQAHWFQ